MADKLGPVFVIWLGMYRALVVSNHEAVKECFTTNNKVFASRPSSGLGKILGYNYAALLCSLWTSLAWDAEAILAGNSLHPSPWWLGELMHVQVSELQAGIKGLYMLGKDNNWVNPKKVVMSEWFEHLNLIVVLRMIAGKRYFNNVVHGSEEARSALAAIKKFLSLARLLWYQMWSHFLNGWIYKAICRLWNLLQRNWTHLHRVEEHRGRLNSEASSGQDFIDVM